MGVVIDLSPCRACCRLRGLLNSRAAECRDCRGRRVALGERGADRLAMVINILAVLALVLAIARAAFGTP